MHLVFKWGQFCAEGEMNFGFSRERTQFCRERERSNAFCVFQVRGPLVKIIGMQRGRAGVGPREYQEEKFTF